LGITPRDEPAAFFRAVQQVGQRHSAVRLPSGITPRVSRQPNVALMRVKLVSVVGGVAPHPMHVGLSTMISTSSAADVAGVAPS
jgi:hypothetical protein